MWLPLFFLKENSPTSRYRPPCFCILLERNFRPNRNQIPVFKTLTQIRSCIMAALKLHTSTTLDSYSALSDTTLELPAESEGISAGFPISGNGFNPARQNPITLVRQYYPDTCSAHDGHG